MKTLAIVIALCLALVGCSYETTTETKKAEISGCEIFRIELKGGNYPLFLAKCKDTATVTYNTGGKSNYTGVTVTMIEKASADLATQQAELDKKKNAIQKLTPEERKVLGLE